MSASAMYPGQFATATAFAAPHDTYWEQRRARRAELIARGASEGKVLVFVDKDEWYPVYELQTEATAYAMQHEEPLEVTPDFLARAKAAHEAFSAIQTEISQMLDRVYE